MTKKSKGEYHGIYINKYPDENYYDFSIQGNTNEVKELISIIRTKLENNKFSDTTCSTLEEYLLYIIQTDKLDTIDIALEVSEESIKIFIKDLGHKREDFTFKNEAEYNRKIDYSEVIGLNNTLITIN